MVPRPTARVFNPTSRRSAQGSAATGRYVETPGATKIYSDPYTYDDSSPLQVEPVQAQPQKSTQAVDQAVDEGNYVQKNVDKEAMLSPEAQRQVVDAATDLASNRATDAAMQGGIVGTAVGTAGYGTNAAIGAGLNTAGNALVNVGSLTNPVSLGVMAAPAFNEYAPKGWAALERTMAFNDIEDDYSGVSATSKRGLSTPLGMPEDQVAAASEDYYNAMQDFYDHSRPLHEQIADSTVGRAVTGFVDDYIVDPFKRHVAYPLAEMVGLRDSADERAQRDMDARAGARARQDINEMLGISPNMDYVDDGIRMNFDRYSWDTPQEQRMSFDDQVIGQAAREGLSEEVMGDAYGQTPDFAQSDYNYNPMQSPQQNMEAMKTQENRKEEQIQKEEKEQSTPTESKSRHKTSYQASGVGFKGSSSGGWNGGVRDTTVSRGYTSNSNPGGFSSASGGNAGGGFGGGGMSNGRGRN